jgi:cob(I)alamin adenosyltransferase
MVRIDRVVTRGGDGGQTSLGDGSRTGKESLRIAAIGEVDEANAAIGLLRCALQTVPALNEALARVQNELFDLGADLCVPGEGGARLRMTAAPVERLDAAIAGLNDRLAPLRSFVLPGGTEAAARAHLARAVVRRAERAVVRAGQEAALNPVLVCYLNRLSDYLFVVARVCNGDGEADVPWVPGAG